MNWRISQLDGYQILSFSDLHSFWPWRLGREATIFDCELTYDAIIHAIRTGDGLHGTIEVDPNYGKYHFDGHRKCNTSLHPDETKKIEGICPVCKRPLTIGVQYRIEELADRPEGYVIENPKKFYTLIPLSELISTVTTKAVATKTVWAIYNEIMKKGKDELDILLNISRSELLEAVPKEIVDVIMLNREGKIKVKPGYDGEYGVPLLQKKKQIIEPDNKVIGGQKGLGDFL